MKPQAPPRDPRDLGTLPEAPVELRSLVGRGAPLASDPGMATIVGAPPPTVSLPLDEERYAMQRRLGQGSMGEVFAAKDGFLCRRVAFKRMIPAVARNPALAARFLTEAQITAQLEHPNIIPIYGVEATRDGSVGYAMKFIEGKTLGQLLEEARAALASFGPSIERGGLMDRLRIFTRICDAMAYAHAKGVLHRDLKPENVMIGRFNQVYVVDWGICRVMHRPDDPLPAPGLPAGGAPGETQGGGTEFGSILGTPSYMSPEQAAGRNHQLDERSDLYTLGLILFEVVTLRQALVGATMQEVVFAAAQGQKQPLHHHDPRVRVPVELRAVINRATALRPEDRYPNVLALAADLRRFRAGDAVVALPDTAVRKAMRLISRHRGWTLAVLLGLFLVGVGGTLGLQLRNAQRTVAERRHRQRLQKLVLAVSRHSHQIDNRLHNYEGLLHGLVGQTLSELRHRAPAPAASPASPASVPPPRRPARRGAAARKNVAAAPAARPTPVYFSDDFAAARGAPPDLKESARYGQQVSLQWPVFKLAPPLRAEPLRGDIDALARLTPSLRGLYRGSGGGLYRLFVTLESGVHLAYPGRGGFPAEYDGRQRPKYRLAVGHRELRWGNAYPDLFGEPLLPCSFPLFDEQDDFLGVAGFDLLLPEMAERLLPMPQLDYVRHVFLVDAEGKVVVEWPAVAHSAAKKGQGELHDNAVLTLKPLPYPVVLEAMKEDARGGYRELPAAGGAAGGSAGGSAVVDRESRSGSAGGDLVIAYAPLESLGWFLVVAADPAPLR